MIQVALDVGLMQEPSEEPGAGRGSPWWRCRRPMPVQVALASGSPGLWSSPVDRGTSSASGRRCRRGSPVPGSMAVGSRLTYAWLARSRCGSGRGRQAGGCRGTFPSEPPDSVKVRWHRSRYSRRSPRRQRRSYVIGRQSRPSTTRNRSRRAATATTSRLRCFGNSLMRSAIDAQTRGVRRLR